MKNNESKEITILKYLNKTPNEWIRIDNNPDLNLTNEECKLIVNDLGYKRKLIEVKSKYEYPDNFIVKINLSGINYLSKILLINNDSNNPIAIPARKIKTGEWVMIILTIIIIILMMIYK